MIEFIDVVKSYPEGNHALRGVSMQIEDGEFCYLVGPSGSGKSTIIKMITVFDLHADTAKGVVALGVRLDDVHKFYHK